jgi:hypothetical protein
MFINANIDLFLNRKKNLNDLNYLNMVQNDLNCLENVKFESYDTKVSFNE